jgi:cell cycle checkpoint protein
MEFSKLLYKKGLLKNLEMVTQSRYEYLFTGHLCGLKMLHSILKAFDFADAALLELTESGMKITVEDSRCLQGSAYIGLNAFREYKRAPNATDENLQFCIGLKVMAQILTEFASDESSMKILYKGPGAPFVLVIEKNTDDHISLITESSIKTRDTIQDPLDYCFDPADTENHIMITAGGDFLELFSDLEVGTSAQTRLEITMSPDPPYFRMATNNERDGSLAIEVDKSSDLLTSFKSKSLVSESYSFNSVKIALKTCVLASVVSLRTNRDGLLNIQIKGHETSNVFVDYYIPALTDDFD